MEEAVTFFVEHGSYGLMTAALLAAGLGLPLPEDIVMISGAILAQRGITDLWLTVLALVVGVFLGDSALFLIARKVGPAIYEWRWIKRVMPGHRREWIEAKIAKHGMLVVFFARHVAGFRGPTFAIAAIHGISYVRFIVADMIALAISLPMWMALGWLFADSWNELVAYTHSVEQAVTIGVISLVVLLIAGHWIAKRLIKRFARRTDADTPGEPERAAASQPSPRTSRDDSAPPPAASPPAAPRDPVAG